MIRALPGTCWVLQWEGHPVTDWGTHYGTAEDAAKDSNGGQLARHKNCGGVVVFDPGPYCMLCESQTISDGDGEQLPVTPAQLPGPCWVAECDCADSDEFMLGEDDGYTIHSSSEAEMTTSVFAWNWQATADGHVYPDECAAPPGTMFLPAPPRRPGKPAPLYQAVIVRRTRERLGAGNATVGWPVHDRDQAVQAVTALMGPRPVEPGPTEGTWLIDLTPAETARLHHNGYLAPGSGEWTVTIDLTDQPA